MRRCSWPFWRRPCAAGRSASLYYLKSVCVDSLVMKSIGEYWFSAFLSPLISVFSSSHPHPGPALLNAAVCTWWGGATLRSGVCGQRSPSAPRARANAVFGPQSQVLARVSGVEVCWSCSAMS